VAETCGVYLNWDGKPPLCGEPAIGILTVACVHEHVERQPVCAPCAAELQRYETGTCVPCERSAEPHRCVMTAHYEWFAEAAS
jgi:hypothetical protein